MNVKLETLEPQKSTYPIQAYIIALAIIFAASTGPIAIRQAQLVGMPSFYIIAVRQLIAALVLTPIVFRNHRAGFKDIQGWDWVWIFISALMFTLNLAFLFLALEFSSVLVTSVLRRTSPLWVIGLEIIFLGAIFTRQVWLGLFFTVGGSILVGLGNGGAIEAGSNPTLGIILALIGSIVIGIYLLIGRKFSDRIPSLLYSWLIFLIGGTLMLMVVLFTGIPLTGYTLEGYSWLLIVTLITQFFGHVPINMGLRYFHATYMSVILQMAVVVSGIIAFFAFNQVPSLLQIIGSGIVLAGIALVSWK